MIRLIGHPKDISTFVIVRSKYLKNSQFGVSNTRHGTRNIETSIQWYFTEMTAYKTSLRKCNPSRMVKIPKKYI